MALLLAERRRIIIIIIIIIIIGKKNKEINCSGLLLPVEILRNGRRYSSSVFTFGYVQESRYKMVQPSSL